MQRPDTTQRPLLSGFTFIRNALKYDFPITEAIDSMAPILDELVVNVGESDDGTEAFIHEHLTKLQKKFPSLIIRRLQNRWNDDLTESGLVLSQQTNLALDACTGRWCLYLQADEALHENDLAILRHEVEAADMLEPEAGDSVIEGFDFTYYHFYGSYSWVKRTWDWYPREIRVIRNLKDIRSFGDAQTFRKMQSKNGKIECTPLKVRSLDLPVYHYGHARDPEVMRKKVLYFHRFWHGDRHGFKMKEGQVFEMDRFSMVPFWGVHPNAYFKRILKAKHELGAMPEETTPTASSKDDFICFCPGALEKGAAALHLGMVQVGLKPSLTKMQKQSEGKTILDFWSAHRSTASLLSDFLSLLFSSCESPIIAFDPDGYLTVESEKWVFRRPGKLPIFNLKRKFRTFLMKKVYTGFLWSSHEFAALPYGGFHIPLDAASIAAVARKFLPL